jgi:toxin ParE1/3/4
MAASIRKRASAKRDLVEHYVYLAENAGIETAERFLTNADKGFADLRQAPRNGRPAILALAEDGRLAQMAGERL